MADQRGDVWDPEQYRRFAAQRAQPFHDLLDLVQPVPGGDVVDLGCGTGELTALLHRRTGAATTLGIDSSPAMLEQARAHAGGGLRFEQGDIADVAGEERFDVVLANASLQWLPDHERLLPRLAATLRPGGQLAVQVPANADHPSHRIAAEVAEEPEFRDALGGRPPHDPVRGVLAPERYAELLAGLGFAEQHVRLQVYGHRLASTDEVVEWVRGTTLGRFRRLLPDDAFAAFVARYRERLLDELGQRAPYFYAFKRILLWGGAPRRGVTGLDHVQLAMPAGQEAAAVAFYQGLLGLPEVPKPANLVGRGGCWFARGPVRVHLGVDGDFRPARKAHPALRVDDLDELVARLRAAGVPVSEDEPLEGAERVYVADPFGNRVELLQPHEPAPSA